MKTILLFIFPFYLMSQNMVIDSIMSNGDTLRTIKILRPNFVVIEGDTLPNACNGWTVEKDSIIIIKRRRRNDKEKD